MAYTTPEQFGVESLGDLFAYAAYTVPILPSLILFGFMITLTLGIYFSQKRLDRQGYFIGAFAASAFVTSILAIMGSLITGFINATTVIITIVIAFVSVLFLLWSRKDN